MKPANKIFLLAICCLGFATLAALAKEVTDTNSAARIERWREARFGLFITWGLYAIPGRGEWVQWNEQIPVNEYAKLAGQFAPTNFSPVSWAALAKAAGMKYTVLVTRHHDGFALFDDGTNTFTSVKSAAHRDFVAEYVKAVRDAGLQVGLYYSPLDWRFPGYILPDLQRESAEAMRAQYHRQVNELLSHYGPLDVLWFDGGGEDWLSFGGQWHGAEWRKRPKLQPYQGGFSWRDDEVYTQLRRWQPGVVINDRTDMPADFHSREGWKALGDFDNEQPWELCVPIAGAWGYQPNLKLRPLKDCVQLLANVAGRDGNLLLNVGPDRNGNIDEPQAQRLREIGAWLRQYGDSIYATRGGPFLPGDWGVSTRREKTIYLHILKWPGETLRLPAIPAEVVKASALTGGTVTFHQTSAGLEISQPADEHAEMDTVIALDLDAPADTVPLAK